jgi:uncharacterized protein (DUF305 family)
MRMTGFVSTAALLVGLAVQPLGFPALAQAVNEDHHPAEAGAAPSPQPDQPAQPMPQGMPPMMQGHDMPMMKGMEGMPMRQGMEGMAGSSGCPKDGPGRAAMMARMAEMGGNDDPVSAAFDAINRRMHAQMAVMPGDDPDRGFAAAMIAHHEGAIDMARVVLGFGKDPEIRKLAEAVITAQQQEIVFLRQWLARQP